MLYNDNGDGTVTDINTDLMWQKNEAEVMDYLDADAYCENSTLGNYTDWRIPNADELRSLLNFELFTDAMDKNYFPNFHQNHYWTSTSCPAATGDELVIINFNSDKTGQMEVYGVFRELKDTAYWKI